MAKISVFVPTDMTAFSGFFAFDGATANESSFSGGNSSVYLYGTVAGTQQTVTTVYFDTDDLLRNPNYSITGVNYPLDLAAATNSFTAFLQFFTQGNDLVTGSSGADTLLGGAGNDTYVVTAGDVIAFENLTGGNDTVQSATTNLSLANAASFLAVENAKLLGSAKLSLTGSSGANVLTGNTGSNVIAGGLGVDLLRGGAGKDFFVFNTTLNGTTNRDSIVDFSAINDTIRLENAIFTGLGARTGALAASKFWASATGVAHDATDRIIYNTTTGVLTYDSNGSAAGGAVAFATLTTKPSISAADFVVI